MLLDLLLEAYTRNVCNQMQLHGFKPITMCNNAKGLYDLSSNEYRIKVIVPIQYSIFRKQIQMGRSVGLGPQFATEG